MMNIHKITEYISSQPFRPFRIRMASGQSFEIRHPEMLLIGINSVRVYTHPADDSEAAPFWHDVSMTLMETLEPIQPQSTVGNNQAS